MQGTNTFYMMQIITLLNLPCLPQLSLCARSPAARLGITRGRGAVLPLHCQLASATDVTSQCTCTCLVYVLAIVHIVYFLCVIKCLLASWVTTTHTCQTANKQYTTASNGPTTPRSRLPRPFPSWGHLTTGQPSTPWRLTPTRCATAPSFHCPWTPRRARGSTSSSW